MVGIIMTKIIHLKDIMIINKNTKEAAIKKTGSLIIFGRKMIITKEISASMITRTRRGLDNFNTNLDKEKIRILRMLNENLVNPVVHRYQIVTYAGKKVIMQINAGQKTKERHQPLIWLCPKFSR